MGDYGPDYGVDYSAAVPSEGIVRGGMTLGMGLGVTRRTGRAGGGTAAFETLWKTDNTGVSPSNSIILPLIASGVYNFNVQWGDGTDDDITTWNDPALTHAYPADDTYTVTIVGQLEGWQFANGGDRRKIIDISSFGPDFVITTDDAFYGCINLTITSSDVLQITTTTAAQMFRDCRKLTTVTGMDSWDVSSVTDMNDMFRDCILFNQNLNSWDVSNVTNFDSVFRDAPAFNQDLSGWVTTALTNLRFMFQNATAFDQDLSGWDVTGVTFAQNMFLNVTLSTANYSALLIGWEGQAVLNNVLFSGGNSKYTAGAAATARADLITDHSWTITDGGPA